MIAVVASIFEHRMILQMTPKCFIFSHWSNLPWFSWWMTTGVRKRPAVRRSQEILNGKCFSSSSYLSLLTDQCDSNMPLFYGYLPAGRVALQFLTWMDDGTSLLYLLRGEMVV